jgi:hypothetical protein
MAYHNRASFQDTPITVTECHYLVPICRSIWRAARFHPGGEHCVFADGAV